ncbi:respiratory-chain NADH dehydrogenase subunit 1 [Ignisphaera aggregans DSM 17230]|uniref:Respiratory-chain NADH dehydrogenase subunit 1 n=1 Tax=Ignisphaera aggregans (strain DSM 17230 / JCM 13409 / AQ1.S1) TaxID=583356 RepID=E0ST34_IGNAA|nr:respiratory-chain NADH dehydrogenase subunit 1 [Ignisphaera aggregans DSM 17230]
MNIGDILMLLISLIVFPGLIFISASSLFTEWFIRKVTARIQNRMGPSYTGPFGILQPFIDFIKLIGVKELKLQRYSSTMLAGLGLLMAIGALVSSLLLLPISIVRIQAPYDVIVLIYLTVVWTLIGLIIAALSYPNPFTIAGVSRMLALATFVEPAWVVALLVPFIATSKLYNCSYSVLCTSRYTLSILGINPLYILPYILGIIAILVASQAKLMYKPFDIPEAEQELISGHITEFSGPVLALYNLAHDIETTVIALIVVYIYLGGPYPYPHLSVPGALLLIIKYFIIVTIITIIRSVFGRFRIDDAIRSIIKYSLTISIIALILSWIM